MIKKIKIEFFSDEDMQEPLGMAMASNVLDAEGQLAILARAIQKKEQVAKSPFRAGEDPDDD